MALVYDCFLFFNELDLLEVRLNVLNDIVDKFVIMESNLTFSGLKKELYFENNKQRFSKFLHKIIHVKVEDTPEQFLDMSKNFKNEIDKDSIMFNKILRSMNNYSHWDKNENHWNRDFFHRECVLRGLVDCKDEDLIILSDLDEIPKPEVIQKLKIECVENNFYHLMNSMYHHYVTVKKNENWYGSKVAKYSFIKNIESNYMRINRHTGIKISDAGWHLTFMGGINKIKEKISAYGHQELNNEHVLSKLEENVNSNKDIFFRPNDTYFNINFEEEFPDYLKQELVKFPIFFR